MTFPISSWDQEFHSQNKVNMFNELELVVKFVWSSVARQKWWKTFFLQYLNAEL